MTDNALSLLGLALRGNNLAVGEEPVKEACKARRAWLVMSADDASDNSVDRAGRMAELGGVPWVRLPWDKETLGRALGRKLCAVAALTDKGLTAALLWKLAGLDPAYRELAEDLAWEVPRRPKPVRRKKKPRAQKPAVREI